MSIYGFRVIMYKRPKGRLIRMMGFCYRNGKENILCNQFLPSRASKRSLEMASIRRSFRPSPKERISVHVSMPPTMPWD